MTDMAIQRTPLAPIGGERHEGCDFRASHPEFVQQMRRLRLRRDREFKRLAALPSREKHSQVRHMLTQNWLRLLYAYKGLHGARRLRGRTPDDVQRLADQSNPFQPSREHVATQWIRSANDRLRPVANFGPLKRAQQMLVADLLRYTNPPLETQFLFRGGVPAAFRAVEGAYQAGFTFATEVDFIDFYGSVRLNGLAQHLRPLPPSVVENVVWDRSMRPAVDDDDVSTDPMAWAYPSLNAQTGLALGSCSSPMAAERIIASLLPADDTCRTVTYADNILVLGRTRDAVETCFEFMQGRAEGVSGWALRLRMDGVSDISHETFQFLHHEGTRRDEGFSWAPDQRKLGQFLAGEQEVALQLDDIAATESKIAHWRRAYPNWPEGDIWETQQLAALAARRFYIDASPLHKTQAINALVASYFASARLRSIMELAPSGVSPDDDRRRSALIEAAEERLLVMAVHAHVGLDAIRYRG